MFGKKDENKKDSTFIEDESSDQVVEESIGDEAESTVKRPKINLNIQMIPDGVDFKPRLKVSEWYRIAHGSRFV